MACDNNITNDDIVEASANLTKLNDWLEGDATFSQQFGDETVPSPSKMIADSRLYIPPIAWSIGLSVSDANQSYTNDDILYAPLPSVLPFVTGGTFDGANWYPLQVILSNVQMLSLTTDILSSDYSGIANIQTSGHTTKSDGGAALWTATGTTTPGSAGTTDYDNGVLFDSVGTEFLINEQVVDVKMFGAVGDGATLDTVAIGSAITFGRNIVFSTSGTYLVNGLDMQAFIMTDGQEVYMYADTLLKRKTGTGNAIMFTMLNNNILKIHVDCNDKEGTASFVTESFGIFADDITVASNCIVQNSVFTDCKFAIFGHGVINSKFMNNHASVCKNSAFQFRSDTSRPLNNLIFSGNTTDDTGDYSIVCFHNTTGTSISDIIMSGNTAKNTQKITNGYAFGIESGAGTTIERVIISDNTIIQTSGGGFTQGGIVISAGSSNCIIANNTMSGITGNGALGIQASASDFCTISGNNITTFDIGIGIDGSSGAVVDGNNLLDCGKDTSNLSAILVGLISETTNATVTNNIVTSSSSHASGSSASIGAISSSGNPLSGINISGNTLINSNGSGILCAGISGDEINEITIENNIIRGGALSNLNGIRTQWLTNGKISNNYMTNHDDGIRLQNSISITVNGNDVIDNRSVVVMTEYLDITGSTFIDVYDNKFLGTTGNKIIPTSRISPTFNNTVKNNLGFVTNNSGSDTVASGGSVSHGLDVTPTYITAIGQGGTPVDIRVNTPGASTFNIQFGGGGSQPFYWYAEYNE